MFGRLNGVIFVLLLFLSSLLGSIFILFPFIPLGFLLPKTFRFLADRFVGYWTTFPAVSFVDFIYEKVGSLLVHDFIHVWSQIQSHWGLNRERQTCTDYHEPQNEIRLAVLLECFIQNGSMAVD